MDGPLPSGSYGHPSGSRIVTSLIIEFTPLSGPRVKRTVEGNGELDGEQREWLVQFITKDLLHLQQLATEQRERRNVAERRNSMTSLVPMSSPLKRDGAAFRQSVGVSGTGTGTHVNESPLRFSSTPGRSFNAPERASVTHAGGSGGGTLSGGGSNLPSSAASNPFELYDENSFVKVICLDQLDVAVVVMFFALDDELADAGGGGTSAMHSVACIPNLHMYAVAVALQNFSAIRLRVALPSIRDWLFNAHQQIMALALEDGSQDGEYGGGGAKQGAASSSGPHRGAYGGDGNNSAPSSDVDGCGGGGGVDVEKEWYTRLFTLNHLLDTWISERVDRDHLDLDSTVFGRNTWSPAYVLGVLTSALSHHRIILRADDRHTVDQWLRTVALFLPDDRLLFASCTCIVPSRAFAQVAGSARSNEYSPILAADLNLQGTTATVNEILEALHLFRHPPVILDVSKKLDDPVHYFPTGTLTLFSESRRRLFSGDRQVLQQGRGILAFQHVRSRPPHLRGSTILGTICSRLRHILLPAAASLTTSGGANTLPQVSSSASVASPSGVGASFASTSTTSMSMASFPRIPQSLAGVNDDVLPSMARLRAAQEAIAAWRKQLLLKAMSFYVYEMELRREGTTSMLPPTLRLQESDHRILQVAVDFLAQVQEAKEKRVRDVLQDTFAF